MVFVKFQEKKILMSPLNSKSFTLQQVKTILQSQFKNVQFSILLFFNLCSDVLSILLKLSVLSFFLHMLCSIMFKFLLLFFFFPSFFYCPVRFCFCFHFFLFFSLFFIINCSFNVPFFFNLISTSLSLP